MIEPVTALPPHTWVVGDVQGCFEALQRLMKVTQFEPGRDRVVLLGDIVNRGPASLEALRWCVETPGVEAILGNHDLHAIGRWLGVYAPRKRDTLDALLGAPDADRLFAWLRARPFVLELPHTQGGAPRGLCVHAGVPPGMGAAEALRLSARLSEILRSSDAPALMAAMRERPARAWPDVFEGPEDAALVAAAQAFVLMRTCDADGRPDLTFDGAPEDAPSALRPWWAFDSRGRADHVVYFGHWAAAGVRAVAGGHGLDAGCVWGRALAALRVGDEHLVSVPALPLNG